MHSWRKLVLYGVLLWLIPFAVAMAAFPLRQSGSPLFETIMAVTLASAAAWIAVRYLVNLPSASWRVGFEAGVAWMAISLLIDAPMFYRGPMQMTLWGYLSDIGFTYLLLPAVAAAVGHAARRG